MDISEVSTVKYYPHDLYEDIEELKEDKFFASFTQIEIVKDKQLKSIQERIVQETTTNKKLLKKISREVEERIKELIYEINNVSVENNKKNNALLNESVEMKKF